MGERTCSVEWCGKAAEKRDWCVGHYRRWQRWGDPLGGRNGVPTPPGMKRCSRCREMLSSDNFNRQAKSRDGWQSTCRSCMSAYQADWYKRNAERLAPVRLEYRTAKRAEFQRRSAEWYSGNRERRLQLGREWRMANPEQARELGRKWRAANPRLVLEYAAERRARVRNLWDEHVDRDIVWARDGGVCHICGQSADPQRWDLDHIVPLSPRDGSTPGRHNYGNVAVSHPSCNYRKSNHPWTQN